MRWSLIFLVVLFSCKSVKKTSSTISQSLDLSEIKSSNELKLTDRDDVVLEDYVERKISKPVVLVVNSQEVIDRIEETFIERSRSQNSKETSSSNSEDVTEMKAESKIDIKLEEKKVIKTSSIRVIFIIIFLLTVAFLIYKYKPL
jgi:metal-dependent amidase/aminoacylase/carboxypeptidase family protein